MDINYGKIKKEKRLSWNGTMPPVLSAALLIILISFIIIAKGLSCSSLNEESVPVMSKSMIKMETLGVHDLKREVLTLIKDVLLPTVKEGRKKSQSLIYYNILEEYLSGTNQQLTEKQAESINNYLINIEEILKSEGKTDYTQLSLDGKKVVFYLLEQIYKDCGLKLIGSADGNIQKISVISGNVLYNNSTDASKLDFQWNTLVIILLLLTTLFITCLFIARKHQLFNKEEKYDGFDEEKFA